MKFVNESLLRSSPFKRPTKTFTDFEKAPAKAVQKIGFGEFIREVYSGMAPPNFVKIFIF